LEKASHPAGLFSLTVAKAPRGKDSVASWLDFDEGRAENRAVFRG
jgi:hypothetical protein